MVARVKELPMTAAEAAELVGLSKVQFLHYCKRGVIGQKVGTVYMVWRHELAQFQKDRRPRGRPRKDV